MTEEELEEAIATRCKQLRLLRLHLPQHVVRMLPPEWRGFPDDLIIGRGALLFAENKSEDGRRTKAQIAMEKAIRRAGGNYHLWRPSDLGDGLGNGIIDAVLRSLA